MYDYENVEIVSIKKGDTLVFFADTDRYALTDISEVMEIVKKAFPTTKVLMLPDDMINDIKIFREEEPWLKAEMKVANSEINKNLSKIDWTKVAPISYDGEKRIDYLDLFGFPDKNE